MSGICVSGNACFVSVRKVLDGSESQYSGMQIGTLQDEEDEGTAPSSQEEAPEPFLQSALGVFSHIFRNEETQKHTVIIIYIIFIC